MSNRCPDWLIAHLQPELIDQLEEEPDHQAFLLPYLEQRLESYDGGDRPPAPPVWLLRALEWAYSEVAKNTGWSG